MSNKPQIHWGISSDYFKAQMEKEILQPSDDYQKIFPVQEGDVVLDLGASIGPFTWKIMDKASKVYAVEAGKECWEPLEANTKGFNVEIVKNFIGTENKKFLYNNGCVSEDSPTDIVESIRFSEFLKRYNVDRIDYIKTDCEGGEYALFQDENMEFLTTKVRDIVGEFHLSHGNPLLKVEFRYWRDKYLTQFPYYKVFSVDGVDITWNLFSDNFINFYNEVYFHISNSKVE